jgi:hypothetical protein
MTMIGRVRGIVVVDEEWVMFGTFRIAMAVHQNVWATETDMGTAVAVVVHRLTLILKETDRNRG